MEEIVKVLNHLKITSGFVNDYPLEPNIHLSRETYFYSKNENNPLKLLEKIQETVNLKL